jgi:hypothetical protein
MLFWLAKMLNQDKNERHLTQQNAKMYSELRL